MKIPAFYLLSSLLILSKSFAYYSHFPIANPQSVTGSSSKVKLSVEDKIRNETRTENHDFGAGYTLGTSGRDPEYGIAYAHASSGDNRHLLLAAYDPISGEWRKDTVRESSKGLFEVKACEGNVAILYTGENSAGSDISKLYHYVYNPQSKAWVRKSLETRTDSSFNEYSINFESKDGIIGYVRTQITKNPSGHVVSTTYTVGASVYDFNANEFISTVGQSATTSTIGVIKGTVQYDVTGGIQGLLGVTDEGWHASTSGDNPLFTMPNSAYALQYFDFDTDNDGNLERIHLLTDMSTGANSVAYDTSLEPDDADPRSISITSETLESLGFSKQYAYGFTSPGIQIETVDISGDISSAPYVNNSAILNLSTRAYVGTGDNRAIAGFSLYAPPEQLDLDSSITNKFLLRVAGPELSNFGVDEEIVLEDPKLTLKDQKTGQTIVQNDNWGVGPYSDSDDIIFVGNDAGAFLLDNGSLSSAITIDLAAGNYGFIAEGKNNTTGVALLELYDFHAFDHDGEENLDRIQAYNISTRGFVGTGDNQMTLGFSIYDADGLNRPRKILFRAIGPGMEKSGISDYLPDPKIDLWSDNDWDWIEDNDDWHDNQNIEEIAEASILAGAFSINGGDKTSSVMLLELYPGNYGLKVSGLGSDKDGITLGEIYLIE